MLDECKGEKFFEILASFSAIVLKKMLATQAGFNTKPVMARSLATSTSLSNSEQASLIPLAIAHKAALKNILRKKEESRRKFTEFGELLDAKADEINQRIRKTVETPRATKPTIPQKEADAIKKQLTDNWIGDQRWVDVMMHGDDQTDAIFLNSSFDKVWRIVERGGRLEDAVPEIGLLEQLQVRVDEQKTRLDKWKSFHERMQRGKASTQDPPKKAVAPAKVFKFEDHVQLQLQSDVSESEPVRLPKLSSVYQDIILEMDDGLSQAASARYNQSFPTTRTRTVHAAHSPISLGHSRSNSIPKKPTVQPSKIQKDLIAPKKISNFTRQSTAPPVDSEATLIGQVSAHPTSALLSPAECSSEDIPVEKPDTCLSDTLPAIKSSREAPSTVLPSPSSSPPAPSSYFPSEPPMLDPTSLSMEEALAAQIVSTIGEATPSPVKKSQPRLSLMERTRMSMVRTNSFEPISESPSLPLPEPSTSTVQDKHAALMERTRLSMAAMSSKPRASLAPKERKSKRSSQVFPVNQFDTPRARKSEFLTVHEELEKTPKEDLFSDDVDYDRVFKSRPRIATSPIFGTPADERAEEDFDEGVTGVDLADVDNSDDDEGSYEQDSPLRNRTYR